MCRNSVKRALFHRATSTLRESTVIISALWTPAQGILLHKKRERERESFARMWKSVTEEPQASQVGKMAASPASALPSSATWTAANSPDYHHTKAFFKDKIKRHVGVC